MTLTVVVLILLAFSAWYVPFRFKRLLSLKAAWPWQIAAFLFLLGYLATLMTGAYTSTSSFMAVVCNIYGLLFIFYVYLFFFMLLTHTLAPLLKKIPGRKIAAGGVIISLALVIFGFVQAQSYKVTSFDMQVEGLARPVSIMHMPDLHLGAQRGQAYLKNIVSTINEYNPNIVLFNGDLVDSNIALNEELFALFKDIKAEVYFTTGNHEFYMNTARALELIAGSGMTVLRNQMVETHGLQLIGLEYMNADRVTFDSHAVNDLTIEEELPRIGREHDKPTLLAHHSPVGIQYMAQGNIDVMVSGHTHGGQVFPGTILTALLFPYNKGLYKIGDMWLLVSQGAGTFGPWMRLGAFNEVQLITLHPSLQDVRAMNDGCVWLRHPLNS